jgi:uncharacterized protein YbaR (Trm112 family)
MSDKRTGRESLDPKVLEMLVCPACRSRLYLIVGEEEFLQCRNGECRRRYPVREGIPVMLIEESEIIAPEEFAKLPFGLGQPPR